MSEKLKLISVFAAGPVDGVDKSLSKFFGTNHLASVVRELFQNSSDAWDLTSTDDGSKKLLFKLTLEKPNNPWSFFDKKDYNIKLKECIHLNKKNGDIKKDLERTQENLNKLHFLKIEDNSGGLNGKSWKDDQTGVSRIITKGNNDKGSSNNNKGTHGIGKDTSFLLSDFFYVSYINRYKNKFNYKLIIS